MAQYPWTEVKTKYETGKYTMDDLADEYGFNASYARRKAGKEGWEKGKRSAEVAELAKKAIIAEEFKKETELRKENYHIVQVIKEKMLKEILKDKPDFNRMKTFKIATEILQNIKGLEWDLIQISDKNKNENDSLSKLAEKLEEARGRGS